MADLCEITYHKLISQSERDRVWMATPHAGGGLILPLVSAVAQEAGWCPRGAWLDPTTDPKGALKDGPIICVIKLTGDDSTHAVVVLSYVGGYVMYLDPNFVDPIAIHESEICKSMGLTFWQLQKEKQ